MLINQFLLFLSKNFAWQYNNLLYASNRLMKPKPKKVSNSKSEDFELDLSGKVIFVPCFSLVSLKKRKFKTEYYSLLIQTFLKFFNSHMIPTLVSARFKRTFFYELYLPHNHIHQIENLENMELLNTLDIRFNQVKQFFLEGNELVNRMPSYRTALFQMHLQLVAIDGLKAKGVPTRGVTYQQQFQVIFLFCGSLD
ncbi:hypothetical protein RFI_07768 [Reticulomyxa filosa]|uniref:Uncharacterized protein n=1 Tax=Reticulomyxa filosa TaxID=46433 RepID=X6NSU2_RETFI|nr:hypothetical protein RFI_07768 [Reticulomyxa filosa]|eukprot:ETO29355.1 hypothetical protein RFI_07768 [Reticulomyxa filosa]